MARWKQIRGVKFSTKQTGDIRLKWKRRLMPSASLADAKKDAEFFVRAGALEVEIQERYPSGAWVTTHIVTRNSLDR
jgi:hypothetical protein